MENASKALIMAGSILIAIIVISLGLVIFRNMSSSVTNNSRLDKEYISSFNSRIMPYLGENISGSQLNALVQLVRTINTKAKQDEDEGKIITLDGKTENFNKYNPGEYYIVHGINDSSNGLIRTITVSSQD